MLVFGLDWFFFVDFGDVFVGMGYDILDGGGGKFFGFCLVLDCGGDWMFGLCF